MNAMSGLGLMLISTRAKGRYRIEQMIPNSIGRVDLRSDGGRCAFDARETAIIHPNIVPPHRADAMIRIGKGPIVGIRAIEAHRSQNASTNSCHA